MSRNSAELKAPSRGWPAPAPAPAASVHAARHSGGSEMTRCASKRHGSMVGARCSLPYERRMSHINCYEDTSAKMKFFETAIIRQIPATRLPPECQDDPAISHQALRQSVGFG